MADAPAPTLPAPASVALDAFRDAVIAAAGDNLVSLVVYGSAARNRYDPATSDLNVVIVLRDASGAAVQRIAPVVHAAQRASRVEPFIVGESELPRLAVTFPTKLLDIQRRHVVLSGRDVFSGIGVSRDDVRQRVEQELRNLALRLRHRFVAARNDEQALALAADDAAAPLAVNLRALLNLRGTVPDEFQPALAIYESAANEFGLDAGVLDAVRRIHKGGEQSMNAEAFARLIDTVSRAADAAAALS